MSPLSFFGTNLQPGQSRAMRLRANPSRAQAARPGHWLWVAQKFRNEAVAITTDRRRQRATRIRPHPALARDGIDPTLAGSVAAAHEEIRRQLVDLGALEPAPLPPSPR